VLPATRQKLESRLYQPKQFLDLATPEGCKAEFTYVTWKRTGWKFLPVNRKSNVLPQRITQRRTMQRTEIQKCK